MLRGVEEKEGGRRKRERRGEERRGEEKEEYARVGQLCQGAKTLLEARHCLGMV